MRNKAVDIALKTFDLAGQHAQPFRLALAVRYRKVRAKIEQIVLNEAQHRVEVACTGKMQPRDAYGGIGLVDSSIRGHPQIVFRAALAGAKRRGAIITRARVD